MMLQAPQGIHAICKRFPKIKIVTSEIDSSIDEHARVIPGMGEFGDRYFGTDNDSSTALKSQRSSGFPCLGTPKWLIFYVVAISNTLVISVLKWTTGVNDTKKKDI